MKNIILNNKLWTVALLLCSFFVLPLLSSCDETDESASTPISVSAVYLEDADSDVPDRPVTFARLGQVLRLEGKGFTGVKKVLVNGYETYINPVYVTDNNLLVQISRETPTSKASDDVRNTIRIIKAATELTYNFEIRSAAPAIILASYSSI